MKKSLINAIKKLLTKLGAQELEGNNLVEVINNGADAIEGGGGSGIMIVSCDYETDTLNKTWTEIKDALSTSLVVIKYTESNEQHMVNSAGYDSRKQLYVVSTGEYIFTTSTADGYPSR